MKNIDIESEITFPFNKHFDHARNRTRDLFLKEVRNATAAHIALMRGSPYVPRTLQMQLMRINICRVLRRWNQFK